MGTFVGTPVEQRQLRHRFLLVLRGRMDVPHGQADVRVPVVLANRIAGGFRRNRRRVTRIRLTASCQRSAGRGSVVDERVQTEADSQWQRREEALGRHLVGSGDSTHIAMVQSANLRDSDDSPGLRRLDRSWLRAVFLQCQVCPAALVIIKEAPEVLVQTSFVEHDHVIEALAADRADHPFDIRTLPWRSWRRKHLFDAHRLRLSNEVLAEDAIAVAQQIARCTLPRKTLPATAEQSTPPSGAP